MMRIIRLLVCGTCCMSVSFMMIHASEKFNIFKSFKRSKSTESKKKKNGGYLSVEEPSMLAQRLDCAIKEGALDTVKLLLDSNPELLTQRVLDATWIDRYKIFPELIIRTKDRHLLRSSWSRICMIKKPILIDHVMAHVDDWSSKGIDGVTPLMIAAQHHSIYGIENLFKKYPDLAVNEKNARGHTALHHAIRFRGNHNIVGTTMLLLHHRASPTVPDVRQKTPLDYLLKHMEYESLSNQQDRYNQVLQLLLEAQKQEDAWFEPYMMSQNVEVKDVL